MGAWGPEIAEPSQMQHPAFLLPSEAKNVFQTSLAVFFPRRESIILDPTTVGARTRQAKAGSWDKSLCKAIFSIAEAPQSWQIAGRDIAGEPALLECGGAVAAGASLWELGPYRLGMAI
ncbi:hypothetical protein EG329_001519 [Mollisiaceae sp. DMI_Dod_QoI]|nr:hypothetical protein EG329_001519 [Helotiales sp. DMI_Dod_QoI]